METIIEGLVKAYQAAGVVGLLVAGIVILGFLLMSLQMGVSKRQTSELKLERARSMTLEDKMREQMGTLLKRCEDECAEKDLRITMLEQACERQQHAVARAESRAEQLQLIVDRYRARGVRLTGEQDIPP